MNWQAKYIENQYFMDLYMEFMQNTSLPYCDALAIMSEITRLNNQNAYIENMTIDAYKNTEIITVHQESRL